MSRLVVVAVVALVGLSASPRASHGQPSGSSRELAELGSHLQLQIHTGAERGRSGAELLAAGFTGKKRAVAAQVFNRLLDSYRTFERKLGLSRNEPAGALALFIVGNLWMYHRAAVSNAQYQRVIAQLRTVAATDPDLIRWIGADRSEVAEQLAVAGILLTVVRLDEMKRPDDAAAEISRRASGAYLELLGINAAALEVTEDGLVKTTRVRLDQRWSDALRDTTDERSRVPEPRSSADPDSATESRGTTLAAQVKSVNVGPRLVVLLRSGDAVYDSKAVLLDASQLKAHRAAHPEQWTQWRRVGNSIEVKDPRKGWSKLRQDEMRNPLPEGLRLDGKYERLRTGIGAAWHWYDFRASGSFTTGGGSGATTYNAVGIREERVQGGTYSVSGYVFATQQGGVRQIHSIMANPQDLDALWIDGEVYFRNRK